MRLNPTVVGSAVAVTRRRAPATAVTRCRAASPVPLSRRAPVRRRSRSTPAIAALLLALAAIVTGGCGSTATGASGAIRIVAAENFWGSIASQLGGGRASTQSIITNPSEDPHSYEPTAGDARTLATAQLAIVNGIGYDPWAPKLIAANPTSGRIVLTVGDLLGLREGDNPHRWYSPGDVEAVADAVTADLKKLDPTHSAYYDQRRRAFENSGLAAYHRLINGIRRRYAGVAVGASESIFALQAPALGLKLITPYSFMKAISEGTEVTAQDTLTTQRQLRDHEVEVWIYNSQNATPAIGHLNALAQARHIPIATITETLSPATASFQRWQVAQLRGIERALHQATGR
jgi:zinc/manganese transport system substrate-binding protein